MLIIPEIETVVILTPRTGSRSLKNAILHRYPRAMLLYRHMEADGVPAGYDQWAKVGVVRDPVDRLYSLYKFLHMIGDAWAPEYQAYVEKMRASVAGRDFSDWLLHNETVFTDPYSSDNSGKFWPEYNVLHRLPENRKPQWITLRPDLGTEVYTAGARLEGRLGIDGMMDRSLNATTTYSGVSSGRTQLSTDASRHILEIFGIDYTLYRTAKS